MNLSRYETRHLVNPLTTPPGATYEIIRGAKVCDNEYNGFLVQGGKRFWTHKTTVHATKAHGLEIKPLKGHQVPNGI